MYKLSDYGYDLPEEKIAQTPSKNRSRSRLMHLNRSDHGIAHYHFDRVADLLRPDDLLVINNTRVIPARLFGKKKTGGKVEILLLDYTNGMHLLKQTGFFECDCMVKASRNPGEGEIILLEEGGTARIIQRKGYLSQIRFAGIPDFHSYLLKYGNMPLPPYIRRNPDVPSPSDTEDYQTVYAAEEGAVAAPTAGLHFTHQLLQTLEENGIRIAPLTLHVGYGTFVPVRVDDIREHQIHSEFFTIPPQSAKMINAAKQSGSRVVAVGTTSVRTLEYMADENGRVKPESGMCDLFIYPGYRFKCVDAMITNFHLPESTLLMLVSAFYDRERMLAAYKKAVEMDYRFFSYGDAMLIE